MLYCIVILAAVNTSWLWREKLNNVDFTSLTIGNLALSHYLAGSYPHATMLFSSTCTLITCISVLMSTNRSLSGAVYRKSLNLQTGQGAKNDTFSNLSLQAKEQCHPNFQYLPRLQQQVLW